MSGIDGTAILSELARPKVRMRGLNFEVPVDLWGEFDTICRQRNVKRKAVLALLVRDFVKSVSVNERAA